VPDNKLAIAGGASKSDAGILAAEDVKAVLKVSATGAARKDHRKQSQPSVKRINKCQVNAHSSNWPGNWPQRRRQARRACLPKHHADGYASNREQQVYQSKAHGTFVPERVSSGTAADESA
jgi:hypothetical protein